MSTNSELGELFRQIADLLDLAGERFKPEAYRRAARSIDALPEDIRKFAQRGELDSIPGVGPAISEKIQEFLRSGKIEYYERQRREFPPGILDLMRLSGIGPKTARRFWVELGVEGPQELAAAIEAGRLTGVKGFGARKIDLVRTALAAAASTARRMPLAEAYELAERIVGALRQSAPIDQIAVAGSLRRRRENIGDLDLLVTSTEAEKVFDAFTALPERRETKLRGPTKETIVLDNGVQVDLRVLEPRSFGAALQYFTGSKDHNVHLRSIARDRGLRINEYAVTRGEERLGGATEEEVYATLGLPVIPAEIRENQGEIEAAMRGTLPNLVDEAGLQGDLHVHLDGTEEGPPLERLATSVRERRWRYLGVVVPSDGRSTLKVAALVGTLRKLLPGDTRVLIGREVDSLEVSAPDRGPGAPDYFLLRAPDGGAPPGPAAAPVPHPLMAVVHLATGPPGGFSDPSRTGPWVEWAHRAGVALEVTAQGAADGLDSATVRRVVELGGSLHLSVGPAIEGPGTLAVGLARRGWATARTIVNARGIDEVLRGPASGRTPA